MNIFLSSINSFSPYVSSVFKESVLSSLTDRQKRIMMITAVALGCIAICYSCYSMIRYYLSPKKQVTPSLVSSKTTEIENTHDPKPIDSTSLPHPDPAPAPQESLPIRYHGKLSGYHKAIYYNRASRDKAFLTGNFEDGYLCGQGEVVFSTRKICVGIFKDSMLNGKGEVRFAHGDVLRGIFKNDVLHGQGEKIESDGTVSTGNFIDGMLNGLGKVVFANKEVHEGFFQNDLLHGHGKIIGRDGTIIQEGLFKNGKFAEKVIKDWYLD